MAAQATFGIDITASDKTAKGKKSAEKTLGQIQQRQNAADRKAADQRERTIGGSGRRMARTFGALEQAAAKALGGKSITSGLADRMGGIGRAASVLGSSLGEASAAGGALGGTFGVVGVAAAGTIGVLAAAAYGAFKLADGWAKGAASIGRTAEIIGVGTKAFQEFTIAAERAGVSRDTAAGAVGGLSQTLNDARYGRNNDAVALLQKMKVSLKTKANGDVDVDAMLPQIADALARQGDSGRRTAARILGIPQAALPAFTQGAKSLSADMDAAGKNGPVITDEGITLGKRVARHDTIGEQAVERKFNDGKELLARGVDVVETAVISSARSMQVSSKTNERAAVTTEHAADKLDRASQRFEGAVNYAGGGGGRLTRAGAISEARKGVHLRDELVRRGVPLADANAIAANAVRESGANPRAREKGGNGRGLFQVTNKSRKALFKKITGVDVENATESQQIDAMLYELEHSEASGWKRAHANGNDAGSVAAGFTRYVERPKDAERDGAERAAVARALETVPVHVTVEHKNAPPGTRTTVKAGSGPRPAISHAFEPGYVPARGG